MPVGTDWRREKRDEELVLASSPSAAGGSTLSEAVGLAGVDAVLESAESFVPAATVADEDEFTEREVVAWS